MRAIKILVFVMGALLLAGFAVVAAELLRGISGLNDRSDAPFAATLDLPPDSRIYGVAEAGGRMAVRVALPDGTERLYILDPATGAVAGTVDLVVGR